MKTFKIQKQEYKKINYDLDATLEMEEVASQIFGSLLSVILGQGTTISLDNFFKEMGKQSKMRECLALIYWEKEEKEFDLEKYEKRVQDFGKMPLKIKTEVAKEVEDFFNGTGTSLLEDFRILSGVIRKKEQTSENLGNSRGAKTPVTE